MGVVFGLRGAFTNCVIHFLFFCRLSVCLSTSHTLHSLLFSHSPHFLTLFALSTHSQHTLSFTQHALVLVFALAACVYLTVAVCLRGASMQLNAYAGSWSQSVSPSYYAVRASVGRRAFALLLLFD